MKNLKRFLCLMLVFLSVFFVACKKPADPNNPNGGNPSTPPSYQGTTTFEVLSKTSTKLTGILTAEKDNETFNNESFSTKYADSFYDRFINKSLQILSKIPSITGLSETINKVNTANGFQDETIVKGSTVEVEKDSSASTIEKLYLRNRSNANKHIIDLTILASKKGYDKNPLNYVLFDYDIEFDVSTEDILFSCRIQNSTSKTEYVGESTSSDCIYYYFTYDTRYNNLDANHFKRTGNLDFSDQSNFESDTITNYILDYDCIIFLNFEKIYPQVGADLNLRNSKTARDFIKSELTSHSEVTTSVSQLESTDTVLENLSEIIIPVLEDLA